MHCKALSTLSPKTATVAEKSPKTATVAENGEKTATVAENGDSGRIRRQSHFSATVAVFGDKLSGLHIKRLFTPPIVVSYLHYRAASV